MDPNEIIQLASLAISAALQIIGKLKSAHGLSDDDVMSAAQAEDAAAGVAISGYLASLPPKS